MQRRSGFTLIEVVIALMFAAILLGVAVTAFGSLQTRMATGQAVRSFQALHARARASAIESGTFARLFVDLAADSVSVRRGGNVLETIHFQEELGVDIEGEYNFLLCMGPRGYADPDCSTFSTPVKLAFTLGEDSEVVEILPLGQLIIR
jgi:prepilin-type N-terminal cleavage/methylation domain-containing protein